MQTFYEPVFSVSSKTNNCMENIELPTNIGRLKQELCTKERQLKEEIKKRKQAERANEELMAKFQEQERLALVGQLAVGIVHDFNNIMAVIVLMTQILRRTINFPFPGRRHLKTIEQQAKLANTLIQHILGFCRQTTHEKKTLNLKPFFSDLANLLYHILPDNILVEFKPGKEEYDIYADPSCIEQVMMNLAVNARDSQPDGGTLIIKLDRVQLEAKDVSGVPAGEWIQITIQDNGGGIHPDILPKIFEPFFTTKTAGSGTGLGLTQVKRIVQEQDGFIDVESEPGIGTTFRLFFPALAPTYGESYALQDVQLEYGQGQLVLLVEDNLDTNEALANSLLFLNYNVVQANNGREGLEILQNPAHKIDLIISDMTMPEIDGIVLHDTIRQKGFTTPFILITGYPVAEAIENRQKEGQLMLLPKPVDLDDLAVLVAKAIAANKNDLGGSD